MYIYTYISMSAMIEAVKSKAQQQKRHMQVSIFNESGTLEMRPRQQGKQLLARPWV